MGARPGNDLAHLHTLALAPRPSPWHGWGVSNLRLRLRRHLQDLERARDALADARAAQADPWRVAELQLRYDRLQERVLDAEFDSGLPPPPRGPAPVLPSAPGSRRRG